jgi:hypothetical protein
MINLNVAQQDLYVNGFLDVELDPEMDLFEEIRKLKKRRMLSFSRIIIKIRTSRILQILLEIVCNCRKRLPGQRLI